MCSLLTHVFTNIGTLCPSLADVAGVTFVTHERTYEARTVPRNVVTLVHPVYAGLWDSHFLQYREWGDSEERSYSEHRSRGVS